VRGVVVAEALEAGKVRAIGVLPSWSSSPRLTASASS